MTFSESSLPIALLREDGNVNVDKLNEFLNAHRSPGKKVRGLIAEIRNEKIPPASNAIEALAKHIWNKEFRFQWYKIEDARNGSLPSLPNLALNWIANLNHKGVVHPLNIPGAFVKREKFIHGKRDNRKFPDLDKVDKVSDAVLKLNSHSSQLAEIYTWGLLEMVDFALNIFPNEESLKQFPKELKSYLATHGLHTLLKNIEGTPPLIHSSQKLD